MANDWSLEVLSNVLISMNCLHIFCSWFSIVFPAYGLHFVCISFNGLTWVSTQAWISDSINVEIVSPIFYDNIGIILLRTSGLTRESRTLSVMFVLDTEVFLLVSKSRRSPTEFILGQICDIWNFSHYVELLVFDFFVLCRIYDIWNVLTSKKSWHFCFSCEEQFVILSFSVREEK